MAIYRADNLSYRGNEALNDAACRGDLATVQLLAVDQSDYAKWIATNNALLNQRWKFVDALIEADLGDFGRNNLIEHAVSLGVLEWTERLLREGTSKQARGFALNRLAEWQRDNGARPAELVDQHHACLRAVLAAGVTVYDRRRARKKALANGDDLLAGWLEV